MSQSKENLASSQLSIGDVEISAKEGRQNKAVSKCLVYAILLSLIIIVGLVVALVVVTMKKFDEAPAKVLLPEQVVQPTPKADKQDDVCLSAECVQAAASLTAAINPKVNPCENFFEFACGTWRKTNVLTEDQSITGTFYRLSDDGDILLKGLLEEEVKQLDLDASQKAKRTYQSCVNEEAIENIGIGEAIPIIKKLGGWPVLGNKDGGHWNENSFKMLDTLLNTRRYTNSPPMIDIYVAVDSKNIEKNILVVDQPVLGMPDRKYYLKARDDKTLMAYETYTVEMAKLFGAATAKEDMKDMVDFEIMLANMSMPEDERRDENKMYNPFTIEALQNEYKDFEWLTYFQKLFGLGDIDIPIGSAETVIVRNPDYLHKLFTAIKNYPKKARVISNYAIWRFLQSVASSLPQRVRDAYQNYRSVLVGSKASKPRWKTCVSVANSRFGLAVGKMFTEVAFDETSKKSALQMIENLRTSMKGLLRGNSWMDDETKQIAIEKADAIEPRIGYPEIVRQNEKLNTKYENYTVTLEAYFNNTLDSKIQSVGKNLRKLREPVDRSKWDMEPAEVNAYYDPTKNQITFPAGILQPPFFQKNNPQYLNYGGIGYVIGHEITHGFDDQGRLYDKTGLLKQWWTNASSESFSKKAQCIIHQYGGYKVEEANEYLNGKLTQGENIADNGGIKESFRAYRKWVDDNMNGREEPKLPGLDYTPNQLFFLNSAHVWCGIVRPAEAKRRIYTDPHSNFKSRVIGPVVNYDEFSKAFNCRQGTPMNPSKKCEIW